MATGGGVGSPGRPRRPYRGPMGRQGRRLGGAGRGAVAALAVVLLGLGTGPAAQGRDAASASTSTLAPTPTPAPAPAPGWDAYGGWTGRTLTATGAFRTAQVDGRWWLVTPDGHPFFSNGVNHVTPEGTRDRNGHAAYLDAITAKYGSTDAWADAQVQRFGTWGINTLGGWSDLDAFAGKGVPYTVTLSLAGFDGTRVADYWDPAWVADVAAATASAAAGRQGDPWLLGYFLDNEVPWTRDWRPGPFAGFLGRPASAPGKQHLVAWLRQRYHDDYAAFAADFATDAPSWAALADPTEATDAGPGAVATRAAWSGEVAERFFGVAHAALHDADPVHLDLGTRFVGQLVLPEVLAAAARHVDVVSINWYEIRDEYKPLIAQLAPTALSTADTLAAHAAVAGKPLLISEFGWRARDSGLPNTYPPLQVVVDTQADRAAGYRNFGTCLANSGYVVGAHWFEMTDEPAIGRFDGEDDNWGMVTEADDEYPLVTAAAAAVHDAAYAPLTDPDWQPGPCTPIRDAPATPPGPATTTTLVPTTTAAPGDATSAPPAEAVTGRARYTG